MNFYIYAPSYNENSGGVIVLHRLCHLINDIESCNAYLIKSEPIHTGKLTIKKICAQIKWHLMQKNKFKVNIQWNTPIWQGKQISEDSIAIYPEVVNGNPLKIKNVVRWFLHQPGYHTGMIKYFRDELYFKFNSAIDDFQKTGSVLSANEMKVIYYPIDIYNQDDTEDVRRDLPSCHMVRKGKDKAHVHDPESVLVDGLSHSEMAKIFKRSKKFISYDDYTAYSIFSILCGCQSVVIPGKNRTINDWYPDEKDRYGIAYGLNPEQIEWAKNTHHKVYEHILSEHEKSSINVEKCVKEMLQYFNVKM